MALHAPSPPISNSSIPPDAFGSDAVAPKRQYAPQSPKITDDPGYSNSRSPSRRRNRSAEGQASPGTPRQTNPRSPHQTTSGGSSSARQRSAKDSPETPTYPPNMEEDPNRSPNGPVMMPPPRTSSSKAQEDAAKTTIPDRTRTNGVSGDARNGEGRSNGTSRRAEGSAPHRQSTRDRPAEMVRENSEVVNRVVVTDPQVDVQRERERIAEATPASEYTNRDHRRSEPVPSAASSASKPTPRSRQDFSGSRRKETRFGDYILGQTLGEGEFGKVKLGWKKDGSVEVAIKLIRLENLNTNPTRLPKIQREISILRELSHPNIVRLHEMVETERHIGIIMEYASGGELFDYILTHRYLRDNAARRLFAQLVSGVGYLHKKGIVHRDLKLENLLLDRNRNIIITDFGFANTFDPKDELSEEIEYNLTSRDFVKKMDLERVRNGYRRGDLMQTSCGSPCYAAPELVVTDSLYTGRKVDVWSCGVILYAMLAGYLPFDDDPANPDGDNINLLYKYIVSTPLTFPEYVTPHARDLLRRILVPDPRKRADLFEVARHSWLSEYAHVVAHITSTTTTLNDINNATVTQDRSAAPLLARSASVREPGKTQATTLSPVGGLQHQRKLEEYNEKAKQSKEAKRRTVQVEYVAPQSSTQRGELSPVVSNEASSPRSPEGTFRIKEPGEDRQAVAAPTSGVPARKPLPQDPPSGAVQSTSRPHQQDADPSSSQPQPARPTTGGSMGSAGRLPSRGNSYGKPVAPAVAATNAEGSLAQPKPAKQYKISGPMHGPQDPYTAPSAASSRPISQHIPPGYQVPTAKQNEQQGKGHKRSNTFGNVFGRTQSLFGGNKEKEKKYPPTSMKGPIAAATGPVPSTPESPRISSDSRRPSLNVSRKSTDASRSDGGRRRFSFLPAGFSLKGMSGGSKEQGTPSRRDSEHSVPPSQHSQPHTPPKQQPEAYENRHFDAAREGSAPHARHVSAPINRIAGTDRPPRSAPNSSAAQNFSTGPAASESTYRRPMDPHRERERGVSYAGQTFQPRYPAGFNDDEQQQGAVASPQPRPSMQAGRYAGGVGSSPNGNRVLQKPNRRFNDAWEHETDSPGHHGGSSGAARRVMDFFRRRGKARAGEDR